MKKALMMVGGGVLALVVIAVVAVSMQPAEAHVERSHVAAATPADVWPHISDMRAFVTWDPWSELDPDMAVEFSDPSSGPGAWYTWSGNQDVGSGKMTITAVTSAGIGLTSPRSTATSVSAIAWRRCSAARRRMGARASVGGPRRSCR